MHTESCYDMKYKLNIKTRDLHACFWNTWPLTLPWDDINLCVFVCKKKAFLRLTPVVYYISLNENMFLWFYFWNILNVCILNTNTWIEIIKFGGHHASTFSTIYSNGGHIGFDNTHTSLTSNINDLKPVCFILSNFEPIECFTYDLHFYTHLLHK